MQDTQRGGGGGGGGGGAGDEEVLALEQGGRGEGHDG